MKILSLFCGRICFALMTLWEKEYPRLLMVLSMTANVLPLSCVSRFFTFSRKKAAGLFTAITLAISWNRVPLGRVVESDRPPEAELLRDTCD